MLKRLDSIKSLKEEGDLKFCLVENEKVQSLKI